MKKMKINCQRQWSTPTEAIISPFSHTKILFYVRFNQNKYSRVCFTCFYSIRTVLLVLMTVSSISRAHVWIYTSFVSESIKDKMCISLEMLTLSEWKFYTQRRAHTQAVRCIYIHVNKESRLTASLFWSEVTLSVFDSLMCGEQCAPHHILTTAIETGETCAVCVIGPWTGMFDLQKIKCVDEKIKRHWMQFSRWQTISSTEKW